MARSRSHFVARLIPPLIWLRTNEIQSYSATWSVVLQFRYIFTITLFLGQQSRAARSQFESERRRKSTFWFWGGGLTDGQRPSICQSPSPASRSGSPSDWLDWPTECTARLERLFRLRACLFPRTRRWIQARYLNTITQVLPWRKIMVERRILIPCYNCSKG